MTALLPYVILAIFFGRAVALEGSIDGIIHMFKPEVISRVEIISLVEIRNHNVQLL